MKASSFGSQSGTAVEAMGSTRPAVVRHWRRDSGWTTGSETKAAGEFTETPSRGTSRPIVRLSRESQILSLSQDPWERGQARKLDDIPAKLMKISA
jgi:hypothetical protein